ncbi:MAG: hypothetical protein ACP5XB_04290 [Isosphaeraceae bacterium]
MRTTSTKKLHLLGWGLLLVGAAVAPVAQEQERKEGPRLRELAEARYKAAGKKYDLIWQYYGQNRVGSIEVYVWSRLLLESRLVLRKSPADRIKALEDHRDRMKALQKLVAKIRRIGFGKSDDVGAAAYYVYEAEFWLAEAKTR